MHDFLMFLKGMAWLAGVGGALVLITFWLLCRDGSAPFDWPVLFGPILPLMSRLGFNVADWSTRSVGNVRIVAAEPTNQFPSTRKALDYLSRRIAAEAEREGAPLTEVERKMLYFSETDWTLPDMKEVSAEFDLVCDQDEYEQKINGLIQKITSRDRAQDHEAQALWDEAIEKLTEGDYYLLVLANSSLSARPAIRPSYDILKLWVTAAGAVFVGAAWVAVLSRLIGPRFWDDQDWLSFHRAGGLLALAPMICLIAIAIRRGWLVAGGRK